MEGAGMDLSFLHLLPGTFWRRKLAAVQVYEQSVRRTFCITQVFKFSGGMMDFVACAVPGPGENDKRSLQIKEKTTLPPWRDQGKGWICGPQATADLVWACGKFDRGQHLSEYSYCGSQEW
jgi:hypothetical protein